MRGDVGRRKGDEVWGGEGRGGERRRSGGERGILGGRRQECNDGGGAICFFCEANVASDDFNHIQCAKNVQVNCRAAADIADSASLRQLARVVCQ